MMRLAAGHSPILPFGSDACGAVAQARGMKDGKPATATARFSGRREAEVTAHVAAIVANLVVEGERRDGVFHIHQRFEPASLLAAIEHETAGKIAR